MLVPSDNYDRGFILGRGHPSRFGGGSPLRISSPTEHSICISILLYATTLATFTKNAWDIDFANTVMLTDETGNANATDFVFGERAEVAVRCTIALSHRYSR
jgi:hypothetical protein